VLLKENPLGKAPSFVIIWCCKDLQHLLILVSNFNFLGFNGGKKFLKESRMVSLKKLKIMSSTTTLKQCPSFESSFDPCLFSLDITFKEIFESTRVCNLIFESAPPGFDEALGVNNIE
jgi:hypothetical protein